MYHEGTGLSRQLRLGLQGRMERISAAGASAWLLRTLVADSATLTVLQSSWRPAQRIAYRRSIVPSV